MVVKSGDTLNSNIRPGLTELINRQIEPLQRKLESTLTSVDSIFSGASYVLNKETQNDIKESLNTLTSAVKAINNSSLIIEKTLTEKNTQINNSIDNIESITTNLSNVSKELNDFGIAGVLSNLEKSVDGINLIVSNLNSDNSSLGKLISNDDVYENLNLSIESLNLLINDIKTNPKKYVHFSVFGRK
jgi:phospholipid/cholesterol/gamma-HCH transport system substrate-binding protein